MNIKMENESILNLCHGCLSGERNIRPITGEFSDIFYKLRNDDEVNQLRDEQLLLCWECVATVKKLKTFQDRIKKAQVLLLDHLKTYCIMGETLGSLCLSSLTEMLNNTFNKVFYEEENLNNKRHDISKDNFKRRILRSTKDKAININNDKRNVYHVAVISSGMITEDHGSEVDKMGVELKLECKDSIKQESNGSENENTDWHDVDYKEDDNSVDGNPSDNCEIECKVENEDNCNSTEKKVNVSLNNGINKRRKYAKYATITRNENISTHNYKQICQTVCLSQKEYDDSVLKKERERLGSRLPFKCEKCNLSFLKNIDLLRHNSFDHNETGYPQKCAACETTIRSEENLSQHWTRVHTTMFRCTLCLDLCRNVADVKRHIRDMHIKTYTCNSCGFACSTFTQFRQHYKTHEVVKCDYCGFGFRKKRSLINHISYSHTPVTCTICNRICSNKNRLRYHNRMQHPESTKVDTSKELSYCVECDKQFPSVLKYQRHLQQSIKHTPRQYIRVPCPDCGKIFSRTNFMRNHYRFAHLKMTKNYCEKCKKYYTTGFGLRQHIQRVHEKKPMPKNKVCDLCGRAFGTNKILENHRRTHTGEKPFKCDYCPASFAQQTAMKTHQRTQHKTDKLNKSLK